MFRVMVPALLLFSVAFSLVGHASGQTRNQGGPDVLTCSPAPCVLPPAQVSEGGNLVNTPSIAADPLDPTHRLMGAYDFNCEFGLGFFMSVNGGSSWTRTCATQYIGLYSPGANPMVAYDRGGTAYIAGIYYHQGYNRGVVGIQSSPDGINWSAPVAALKQGNFPFNAALAADVSDFSAYVNSLYISAVINTGGPYRVYVSHSFDGGATWKQVAVAPGQVPPDFDQYTNMTIGKNGTVYLTWMYCNAGPNVCSDHKGYMVFSKSIDGGNTWSTPRLMTTASLLSTYLPNTGVGVTDYPAIGVDNGSGPYAGNLYVVMYSWTGSYMRVGVIRSTDDGKTWSKPVPVASPSANHDQFFPWLSVSSTGLVGVSWLDRRNDPANINYQAFVAISTDGGRSFQPNVQLTTAFSNPNVNGYVNNAWMGDYTGNTWAGPNNFVAAWMDSSNGVDMQVMVGGIRLK